jgi:hypothetical protein
MANEIARRVSVDFGSCAHLTGIGMYLGSQSAGKDRNLRDQMHEQEN